MTHRNGHQDGDRYSRKQQLAGHRPRNENNRQNQQYLQHQNWGHENTRRPYPERPMASGYDEDSIGNFGPSYASSDYYSRNVDSERGLYTGDPNQSYLTNRQNFGPEAGYAEPRYFMTRPREPLPYYENEARKQSQRFSNEDWSGHGYGDQDYLSHGSGSSQTSAYGDPGYVPSHDYQARLQGDYFSQPYSTGKSGYETGHRGKGPKGYMRSDDRLKEDISERLADDYFIDASDIEVQSKDGIVTLNGTVSSRQLKHRVEDIIERCHGVKDIDNRLKIKNPAASEQRMSSASQNAPGSQSNKKQ